MSFSDHSKVEAGRSKNPLEMGAGRPPLGNYAKLSDTKQGLKPLEPTTDKAPNTNILKETQRLSNVWDYDAQLSEKYALQNMARKAMLEHYYKFIGAENEKANI